MECEECELSWRDLAEKSSRVWSRSRTRRGLHWPDVGDRRGGLIMWTWVCSVNFCRFSSLALCSIHCALDFHLLRYVEFGIHQNTYRNSSTMQMIWD